jgi:hypothetical protein
MKIMHWISTLFSERFKGRRFITLMKSGEITGGSKAQKPLLTSKAAGVSSVQGSFLKHIVRSSRCSSGAVWRFKKSIIMINAGQGTSIILND